MNTMAEVWSFNTTVRNPERMERLLRNLSDIEGTEFNLDGQEKFFAQQIKKRNYRPTKATLISDHLINAVYGEGLADDLDEEIVEEILEKYRESDVDGSGRGRTSAGILNRFGLCRALQSHGPVVITQLGKRWLAGEIDDEELFTKFFLKWQYPNPLESGYGEFNIKPFIAVIRLIDSLNKEWKHLGNKPVGISKQEYQLFVPALKIESDIDVSVKGIIDFRRKKSALSGKKRAEYIAEYSRQRIIKIFGNTNEEGLRKHNGALRDYTDSSIRYFRVSGLLAFRGGGHYIDIASDRIVEVRSILNSVKVTATNFETAEEYLNYLNDASYNLPWENEKDLLNISSKLKSILENEKPTPKIEAWVKESQNEPLVKQVKILQETVNETRIEKLRLLKHDVEALDEAIKKLSTIFSNKYETVTTRPSLDFEWFVSRSLMVLNDAIKIEPSFKIGDDGLPTGFRGNVSDIECEYKSFGLTMEVTLLTGRDQWVAEGQPVQRHLRDFEDKLPENKTGYCIFVAPYIHRDTLNTFWMSNKFGYEGTRQNILPLNLEQFIKFLKISRKKILHSELDHSDILKFLESICFEIDKYNDVYAWKDNFTSLIDKW